MSTQHGAGRVRSAYEFIKGHQDQYNVRMMCRVLEVAPSGYYKWLQQPISNRAKEDARLLRLIRASFVASHGIYGAPRVFLDLREAGETCSKRRVARLMREAKLRALHGYRIRRWTAGKPSVLNSESPAATIHSFAAKQGLGDRYHLHSDVAGLALPGSRHGSVLAPDRRLGGRSRARAERCAHGGAPPATTARHVDPL
jgi:HTH-like domain